MATDIADVRLWVVEAGIGHAVEWSKGLCEAATACGMWMLGVKELAPTKPARVCRKCRERLASPECRAVTGTGE